MIEDDVDSTNGSVNYVEMCPPERTLYRYLTTMLHLVLIASIVGLVSMGLYFLRTPCEPCDYYNRVLAIGIWIKSICHVHLTIVRVKKRDEIENNERFRSLVIYLIKLFNSLTFLLVLLSLHLLHFYRNKCSFNTLALKFIKLYYYLTITLYFLPLLFYISLGLFLSIIICVIVNFSVDENDRIPTPENVISKLTVLKYSDINFVRGNSRNEQKKKKKKLKKPSFEVIFDKVKRVMQRKDNREEEKKKKKKFRDSFSVRNTPPPLVDDQLKEMLNPLKGSNNPNENFDSVNGESPGKVPTPGSEVASNGVGSSHLGVDNDQADEEGYQEVDDEGTEEDEDICSICMMNYVRSDDVMMMPCDKRHFFHVGCLTKWLYKSQACPICRTNIVSCLNAQGEVV
ncbi:RING zinc finger protein, putative [Plasmodium knowlesi strain H]|uniref:RING-type E3 ubiquitin transferase n=3 Tax=Plasmodium knowlesi TaxID=5850 RepID=B3L7Y5_PLAKH|nr:RING zinc finger protein, putative [Plasmodium knowlesi strain H]OTN64427.1 putative RING zinc finger protein [Plasmodium knowlesi]CAA9989257.1 RING zinc finger protein, putative [Plasmodium knowlesi strain H]SBO26173.1 RING zinc finger protein, putative [Plasmodium knowlesi strain H]VVS78731.1 RING zinc finger protein, putative [Plasmodium knowlesi strain H]|eukprot:XP_002261603.1 Zinc finger protein, putative [Plasmodium knowlesi strain H]